MSRLRDAFSEKWRHVRYNWEVGGFWALATKVWQRGLSLVYLRKSYWIMELDLEKFDGGAELALEHRVATEELLREIGYEKLINFPELVRRRLERGAVCHVFFDNGRFVNMRWTVDGFLPIESGLSVSHGRCRCVFDGFTVPEFQRRGINVQSHAHIARLAKADGLDRLLGAVHPDNVPSIRSLERVGYTRLYYLSWRRILGIALREEIHQSNAYRAFPAKYQSLLSSDLRPTMV